MIKNDETGLPLATNHAGWNVQVLAEDGWSLMHPEPLEMHEAEWLLNVLKTELPDNEFRRYEALIPPEKKWKLF
jgi:hypothetical protein